MIRKFSENGYKKALAGIDQKTLVHGNRTLMVEFKLQKDASLPMHSHPHEQIGYLVKGWIQLTIDSEVYDITPGDSWCIPGGIQHGAEIMMDSVAIEVFSPVREDYLPSKKNKEI
jgi:quercetin dioxygenase-like cupin family protein